MWREKIQNMERSDKPEFLPGLLRIILLSGAAALLYWQVGHPFLRFAWPPLNSTCFLAGLLLPWVALLQLVLLRRWWTTAIAALAALPLLLCSLVILIGAILFDTTPAFERIAEMHWAGSSVRIYRTNGGATTAYGIVIRQERTVLPGVLLVRNIDSFYPCYSIDLAGTPDGFQVLPPHDGYCVARQQVYRLKRFVYF